MVMKAKQYILFSWFALKTVNGNSLKYIDSPRALSPVTAKLCLHVCVRLFCPTNYRLLGDLVMHFPMSQDEITLSTSSQRVSVRNYCEDGKSELDKTVGDCDCDICH